MGDTAWRCLSDAHFSSWGCARRRAGDAGAPIQDPTPCAPAVLNLILTLRWEGVHSISATSRASLFKSRSPRRGLRREGGGKGVEGGWGGPRVNGSSIIPANSPLILAPESPCVLCFSFAGAGCRHGRAGCVLNQLAQAMLRHQVLAYEWQSCHRRCFTFFFSSKNRHSCQGPKARGQMPRPEGAWPNAAY